MRRNLMTLGVLAIRETVLCEGCIDGYHHEFHVPADWLNRPRFATAEESAMLRTRPIPF